MGCLKQLAELLFAKAGVHSVLQMCTAHDLSTFSVTLHLPVTHTNTHCLPTQSSEQLVAAEDAATNCWMGLQAQHQELQAQKTQAVIKVRRLLDDQLEAFTRGEGGHGNVCMMGQNTRLWHAPHIHGSDAICMLLRCAALVSLKP